MVFAVAAAPPLKKHGNLLSPYSTTSLLATFSFTIKQDIVMFANYLVITKAFISNPVKIKIMCCIACLSGASKYYDGAPKIFRRGYQCKKLNYKQ